MTDLLIVFFRRTSATAAVRYLVILICFPVITIFDSFLPVMIIRVRVCCLLPYRFPASSAGKLCNLYGSAACLLNHYRILQVMTERLYDYSPFHTFPADATTYIIDTTISTGTFISAIAHFIDICLMSLRRITVRVLDFSYPHTLQYVLSCPYSVQVAGIFSVT